MADQDVPPHLPDFFQDFIFLPLFIRDPPPDHVIQQLQFIPAHVPHPHRPVRVAQVRVSVHQVVMLPLHVEVGNGNVGIGD